MRFIKTTGDPAFDREIDALWETREEQASSAAQANAIPVTPSPSPAPVGVRTLFATFQVAGDVTFTDTGLLVITQSGNNFDFNVPGGSSATTLTFSGARVYNSANIAISNNTETALTFDTERYDTSAYHSTSSNTSRLVAPVTGYYRIGAGIEWDAGVGATMLTAELSIRLNGTTFLASSDAPVGVRFVKQDVQTEYRLTAGDYVEITVNGSIAVGSPAIINAGNISPEAYISLMGV